MQPVANDSRCGHLRGLSIRLEDGTLVSVEAVIAEGRRQQAREIRRLVAAAAHGIARIVGTTARTFASLAPAHESRRKIPALDAERVAGDRRKTDERPLAA